MTTYINHLVTDCHLKKFLENMTELLYLNINESSINSFRIKIMIIFTLIMLLAKFHIRVKMMERKPNFYKHYLNKKLNTIIIYIIPSKRNLRFISGKVESLASNNCVVDKIIQNDLGFSLSSLP